MLSNPFNKKIRIQVLPRLSANNYVKILDVYYLFIYNGILERYGLNSIFL